MPLSTPNETGDTGIVQVIPEGSPDSEETKDLVATLRSMHDQFEQEYGVDLSVTGYTAAGIDISDRLAGALLPFGLLVVGLSLVLLAMVFRSIVVPVTAALGYVLSVGAAFGLTSLVFVDGVFADAAQRGRRRLGRSASCRSSSWACSSASRWTTRCSWSAACGRTSSTTAIP